MIWLSTFACFPACCRTPEASYMTMAEKTKLIANSTESIPRTKPIAVLRPTTNALCEDGMPPDPTRRERSHLCSTYHVVNTLATCANRNDRNAATSGALLRREVMCAAW